MTLTPEGLDGQLPDDDAEALSILTAALYDAALDRGLWPAAMGVAIPWLRARGGRDPAPGSSVLITAVTDSGGFFIFLGLATLFLV